jgi:hypothetical protein
MRRLLAGLLLLYLVMDFTSAQLPGAFEFDCDDSVEVVRLDRDPAPAPPALAATPEREWFVAPIERPLTLTAVRRTDVPRIIPLHIWQRLAPDPGSTLEG